MQLRDVQLGDFFKLKSNGKVYVRGHYEPSLKKYSYHDYDDVNNEHFAKGSKLVITDFEF